MPDPICPICVNSIYRPYRVKDARGKVIQGCVHPCHDDHLVGESRSWSLRKEAKAIRKEIKHLPVREG